MSHRDLVPYRPGVPGPVAEAPERPPVGGTLLAGVLVLVLGLGGFGWWAGTAPLASAVVAPGIVTVDSNRKVVQHLEGGAIAELLVREGDRVAAGQVLVRLDDLESRALHDLLDGEATALKARQARLEAQRDGAEKLVFPRDLEARRGDPEVAEILAAQERIFASGREALRGEVEVLRQRIAQLEAAIAALKAQYETGAEQLALIEDETATVRNLVARGFERRPRLLALQREGARLRGLQGDYANRMAQTRETIAETELQILNATRRQAEQAALELGEVETRLAQTRERLAEAAAKLKRRDVPAPEAGTVLNLRYHTVGGVVPPGGPILDLVPEEDRLVIEAHIQPMDIESVQVGQPTLVALTAFKMRTTPQVHGTVAQVSADALVDERTGLSHFNARIAVDPAELERYDNLRLAPGMPAEAYINTGERTLLAYLLQPITDSFRRAFREG